MTMSKRTSLSLIIATYNWPEALELVLQSVLSQRVMPDEVVIADDGSRAATKQLIDSYRNRFPVPLKHYWHPDDGFRKAIIVNQAIAGATGKYIVQIDGDIVMHERFIQDHLDFAEKGFYVRGSRVMIEEERSRILLNLGEIKGLNLFSKGISNRFNALRVPLITSFFVKKSKRSDNVHGCNISFWREDFIKVNGYNNDLRGWGHEDIELAARFVNLGLRQKKVKMKAVCYHLHHPLADRQRESINYKIYQGTLRKGISYCPNGYIQNVLVN